MTDRELDGFKLGWVVGIIEGEGWFGSSGGRAGQTTLRVDMSDRDVILRLHEWTGVGNVTGPRRLNEDRKPMWQWTITRRDDAAWLIGKCVPHFGERRKAHALAVLDAYRENGPTRGTATTCSYGHDISEGSPNLRVVDDGKYTRRRCLKCQARRQQECRARAAAK